MLGLRFIKVGPTTYLLHYKNGAVRREGTGLAFYYFAPTSTLATVPMGSVDVPFVFNEITADFQQVTVQGQLTYRVVDPKKLANVLNYTVHPNGRYISNDPEKLSERLVAWCQVLTSGVTQKLALRQVLVAFESMSQQVLAGLQAAEGVKMLGLEILGLSILSIAPTPETAKALEAEAREALQRKSDEATYARRNAAVELERKIKESELNTELMVEEKLRQKRETKVAADIAIEEQRKKLVAIQAENDQKEADSRAYGVEALLKPVRGVDWRILMAVSGGKWDAKTHMAMAFRDLAENAQKVGELNISPDLLAALTRDGETKAK